MELNDRKNEILHLQQQIIEGLQKSMKNIGSDLWGTGNPETGLRPQTGSVPSGDESPLPGFDMPLPVFGKPYTKKADPEPAQNAPENQTLTASGTASEEEASEPPENIEDLKKELNGYIGLDNIKEQVESLINWISINQKRKDMGLKTPDLSLHMVFSGNPGTGKTMVARLMSRIFHSLGILSKGHLIEVDRSGLVAGYVGQTAIKTKEICDKAKGGVLFIDEAYALTNKGGQDYGQEAVDTILKAMEDDRDDLVVIVAGYIELMEEFIHSNPGLESRFNRYMHFADYTVDEMLGIFNMRCSQGGYTLSEDAEEPLRALLTEKSKDVKGFGNARGVRNLFEKAIAAQADRLAKLPLEAEFTKELLMTLTPEDINSAAC